MDRADPNTQPGPKPPAPDVPQPSAIPAEPPPPRELPQDDPLPGGNDAAERAVAGRQRQGAAQV